MAARMALRSIANPLGHSEKHVLPLRFRGVAGQTGRPFPDHAFGPRCVGGAAAEVNSAPSLPKFTARRGIPAPFPALSPGFSTCRLPAIHAEERVAFNHGVRRPRSA